MKRRSADLLLSARSGASQHHRTRRNDRNVEDAIRCRSRTPRVRQRHRSRHPPMRGGAAFVVSGASIGKLKFSIAGGSSFSATNRDWTTAGTMTGAGTSVDEVGDDVLCAPVITHPRSRLRRSCRTRTPRSRTSPPTRDTGTAQPQTESPISVDGRDTRGTSARRGRGRRGTTW